MLNPIERFIQIEKRLYAPPTWRIDHWRWHSLTISTPWFFVSLGHNLNLDHKWWRTFTRN